MFHKHSDIALYHPNNLNNVTAIEMGKATMYFSYNTLIAFDDGDKIYVVDSVPGKASMTTFKHMSLIDPYKLYRVSFEKVQQKANEYFGVV
jgi:hypothetical protein